MQILNCLCKLKVLGHYFFLKLSSSQPPPFFLIPPPAGESGIVARVAIVTDVHLLIALLSFHNVDNIVFHIDAIWQYTVKNCFDAIDKIIFKHTAIILKDLVRVLHRPAKVT